MIDFIKIPLPDDSISYFKSFVLLSEEYWKSTPPNPNLYGFQIQQGSKWRPGLSDSEIADFEKSVHVTFPVALKNFYKTMNGLTKPGINLFASNNASVWTYAPLFYSYPDDLDIIRNKIDWIYEEHKVTVNDLASQGISKIFPAFSHRFMLVDLKESPILSMHGTDVIYWADNISKLLVNEIFNNIYNVYDFESYPDSGSSIKFWLDEN